MISYAQNWEDVVLARVFAGQSTGRYVDIGACDPVEDSVTKHFYDIGWRGINIEPLPVKADQLRAARPEDTTLQVAVGAEPGKATLHVVNDGLGRSTLDGELAGQYREDQHWQVEDLEVEVVTLAEVLDEHPGAVDFLKIDVEGAEQDVIEGAAWDRHRPRVLVVEATAPGVPTPTYGGWEPVLLDSGYRCVLFDGLNRFYAQADDADAVEALSAPANVFDEFEPYAVVRLREELARQPSVRAAEVGYVRRLEERLREAQQARAQDVEYIKTLEEAVAAERHRATKAARYAAALESRVAELTASRNVPPPAEVTPREKQDPA
ncbi:FkbM family methyltransferase [Amycolatopsis dongchuanensis]|uniref:FkbM family methyltransferase n=1 Tax=Amycolatopsis dongchuanensis TaxID=1070866 RepID=A0ABP9Q832_9PSEU